jgi:hypothetical protein
MAVLAACDALRRSDTSPELPTLLLAQGRLHRWFDAFGWPHGEDAAAFERYMHAHPAYFERDRHYSGDHLARLVGLFPHSQAAADARCELAMLRSRGNGPSWWDAWDPSVCEPLLERVRPGPCPTSLRGSADPVAAAFACEASARHARGAEAPRLLLAAGRLFIELADLHDETGCARLDEARWLRSDAFFFAHEINYRFYYKGVHLQTVVDRWPGTIEADDALWELVRLSLGGECEGNLGCYVEANAKQLGKYVSRLPRGRHSGDLVSDVEVALRRTADGMTRPGADTDGLGAVMERLEQDAAPLDLSLRLRLLRAVLPVWSGLHDTDRYEQLRRELARLEAERSRH